MNIVWGAVCKIIPEFSHSLYVKIDSHVVRLSICVRFLSLSSSESKVGISESKLSVSEFKFSVSEYRLGVSEFMIGVSESAFTTSE